MTPKQFIKYTQYLDKNNLAICDGITEGIDYWTILQNIIIIGGIGGLGLFIINKFHNIFKEK